MILSPTLDLFSSRVISPTTVFFPLTRAYLGLFVHVYPNGQSWFTNFVCYSTMYHDLNRSASILHQTWEAFKDFAPWSGTLEASPMTPKDLVAADLQG